MSEFTDESESGRPDEGLGLLRGQLSNGTLRYVGVLTFGVVLGIMGVDFGCGRGSVECRDGPRRRM